MKVFKVYDHECPICEKMALFDHSVILRLEVQPDYRTVELGHLLDQGNSNYEDALLTMCVERHACNPDYTLDLPVYVVMSGKTYLGHLVGEHTAADLQTKLEGIINGAQNKEGQDNLNNQRPGTPSVRI